MAFEPLDSWSAINLGQELQSTRQGKNTGEGAAGRMENKNAAILTGRNQRQEASKLFTVCRSSGVFRFRKGRESALV